MVGGKPGGTRVGCRGCTGGLCGAASRADDDPCAVFGAPLGERRGCSSSHSDAVFDSSGGAAGATSRGSSRRTACGSSRCTACGSFCPFDSSGTRCCALVGPYGGGPYVVADADCSFWLGSSSGLPAGPASCGATDSYLGSQADASDTWNGDSPQRPRSGTAASRYAATPAIDYSPNSRRGLSELVPT